MVIRDMTKHSRGGSWVLDAETAEAIRRWRTTCPSRYVFPASALHLHRQMDEKLLALAGI
jgi:hypothetical protein